MMLRLKTAFLACGLATNIAADLVEATSTVPASFVGTASLQKPEGIDDAPRPNEIVNTQPGLVESSAGRGKVGSNCGLAIKWTSNWDEVGRRYRVLAKPILDGPVKEEDDPLNQMTAIWANKCRSIPNNGWNHNAVAWQQPGTTDAFCDISFVHGSVGHDQYLAWHNEVADQWRELYPGCWVYLWV
ncbi:uncharacterized protein B0I36DRAFT_348698 [Microdochium trichocladiopsis]|uniref:Secreted protein n=1 Tax=Microdochium trichocladiopsis TaxID=1682393 RepID=A0A9P8YAH7_9PEZI|nr:uncharacterized protein B0I36DRAFT_348698 [Microdochium trichocladiopsis]KAH7033666.1 hypothetical protein B0I36DRAFT_348698 [Microdochium trichocladiopsis]